MHPYMVGPALESVGYSNAGVLGGESAAKTLSGWVYKRWAYTLTVVHRSYLPSVIEILTPQEESLFLPSPLSPRPLFLLPSPALPLSNSNM
jgi:hypothetical protein